MDYCWHLDCHASLHHRRRLVNEARMVLQQELVRSNHHRRHDYMQLLMELARVPDRRLHRESWNRRQLVPE